MCEDFKTKFRLLEVAQMKRKEVRAEGLGAALDSTNSNTMNDLLKEGIKMKFRKFSGRIGVTLALSVACWLVVGAVSESVAQAQLQFSLNPNSGATTAPGRTQFQVNGQLQGSGATWTCQIQSGMIPAGITVAFNPGIVTVSPFRNGGQASSTANVNVAAGVAAGTYPLNVVVNCSGYWNGQVAQWGQAFVYTLQVTGGGPNLGPCQFNFAFEPPVGNLIQVQNTQDPMAWAWAANVTIVSIAQGNCPATSRFTARLAYNNRGPINPFLMMQPPPGLGAIPGRVGTTIMAQNAAGSNPTAVIQICASESDRWLNPRCQNYNYQLRRGGGTPPAPGPGQARVRVVATPNPARLGETITFSLINEGPSTLQLPNPAPWRIVNQTSGQTFGTPGAVIQVVTNVAPGETRSWTWDQRTPMGNQAPPGNYTFIVTTLNGDPREPSVSFSIQGAGGQGPGPGSLMVQLAVDRGCGVTYRIGDPISITFSTSQDALVTLTLIRPDGSQQVLVANQSVRGGVANTIQGMVGEPGGTRTLILEATAGQTRGRAECAFTAGGASTTPPPAQFQAFLSTDRGCQETGQNPVYYVGDPIVVQFRIDGAAQAFVTLEDVLPDGQINVLLQQWVPGNVALQLMGWIAPPLGRETLRLTVQVGQQVVVAECSFTVAQ